LTTFFHSSPVLLSPGSIILPGNYGRIIRLIGPQHPLHARETVLENVRVQHFPEKPSRLESCFACTSEETSRFYVRAMATKPGGSATWPIQYEVEKVDADAVEHRADFNVVEPLPGYPATMEEIAYRYWTASLWTNVVEAPGIRLEEVVTPSPFRILRKLD
jgi:hypothetical protein